MTRDRLQEMKALMRVAGYEEEVVTLETEKSTALVKFFEHVKDVKLEVAELKKRVKDLKILMNDNQQWMNGPKRRQLERKIEEEKLIIGTTAKTIRSNLKSMKNVPPDQKQTSVILRIKQVQLNAVLNELNDILRDYLNCLLEQREKSFKILKDMIEVKGGDLNDVDSLLEEGKIAIFTNNLLINDMEEKYMLREAEDRCDSLLKIESSILEVRNLFNELALIVDLQSEKIDEVEKLVDENLVKVEKGKKKLKSASKKKEKGRYRKVMVGFVCCGIILIVIILLTAL